MADMNLHEYIVNGGRNFFSEGTLALALQLGYLPNFLLLGSGSFDGNIGHSLVQYLHKRVNLVI